MSDTENAAISEDFIKHVKDVLANLYDIPYLQRHPLARSVRSGTMSSGQQLRHEFIDAIENLNPNKNQLLRKPQDVRIYNLLHLHYVEGLGVEDVSMQLGLSTRQLYRDLKQAQLDVAAVVWSKRQSKKDETSPSIADITAIHSEVSRLHPTLKPVILNELLQSAYKTVERFAHSRGVQVYIETPLDQISISTDISMGQQILVQILSHVIEVADKKITIILENGELGSSLTIQYTCDTESQFSLVQHTAIIELIDQLGWVIKQTEDAGIHQLQLLLTPKETTIVIIDDNEGFVEVLWHYLSSQNCQVLTATNNAQGWELILNSTPDAIILDVMMPDGDGWELLQRIRAHPQMATTPVIMCSVFNNPSLAYSLGATQFMTKPTAMDNVERILQELGVF